MALSKTQVDRLGDRLKKGSHTESDVRMLDEYRRSFGEAYEAVVGTLRERGAFPTGRLAKSTVSIVEKLRRESIRLSQMQDIAGCRVIVNDVLEQDKFVAELKLDFPESTVIDRRESPSHGYRAVHVTVKMSGKLIEIQVRSALQHLWAELSEKSSDVLDPAIKYGGGDQQWRHSLAINSELIATIEKVEKIQNENLRRGKEAESTFEETKRNVKKMRREHRPNPEKKKHQKEELKLLAREKDRLAWKDNEHRQALQRLREAVTDDLTKAIADLDQRREQKK